MNREETYQRWLEQKQSTDVSDAFAERVMMAVHRESNRQSVSHWDQWVITPLAQAGLAVGALLVLVVRFMILFTAAVG